MKFLIIFTALLLLFFISTTTTIEAKTLSEDKRNDFFHHTHNPDNKHTICNITPSAVECTLFLETSTCGLENPFYCRLPTNAAYECLNYWDVNNTHHTCDGGCFDLRKCGTPSCSQNCSKDQCTSAFAIGKVCPDKTGPEYPYLCTNGPLENFCGANRGVTDRCYDSALCFDNNPRCFDCCDFNSCLKYETCFGVQCPQNACDNMGVCNWRNPFYCLDGNLQNGCSNVPTYFPKDGCPKCCDLNTCRPNPCGVCPPEKCNADGTSKVCPSAEAPVVCLNSTKYPENVGKCMPYGYWPPSRECDDCCACTPQ